MTSEGDRNCRVNISNENCYEQEINYCKERHLHQMAKTFIINSVWCKVHDQSVDAGKSSGTQSVPRSANSTSYRTQLDDHVLTEIRKINPSVRTIADRVGVLESERRAYRAAPPMTKRRATESRSWASCMDEEASEPGTLSNEEREETAQGPLCCQRKIWPCSPLPLAAPSQTE